LPAVRFGGAGGWTHDFERDPRGRLGAMRSSLAPKSQANLASDRLLELLAALPVDALSSFKVAKSPASSRLAREKVNEVLARFRTLTEVDLSWST
jgi:YD repeat-containing protein